jgi:hypothetical protein
MRWPPRKRRARSISSTVAHRINSGRKAHRLESAVIARKLELGEPLVSTINWLTRSCRFTGTVFQE